ncbi:hypothetical protein F5884DRAFT_212493 [Xylogone sp. PMI_703]|nr:hypothetical protein F5884DRAFT_212493 [Xylogone sp. PMI_703]
MNQSDAPNMQSYPSPNAVAADRGGPFYNSSSNPQAPMANPEELQLAAQLSRGLAPVMGAGQVAVMTEGQDPRSQVNVHHQYEQDPQGHPVHQQGNHGPMDQMGNQYGTPDGSMAPRKRSKVSRACDECRRKKIRCDATGEPGDEQCSSCKRVGTRCQFSRVPMKRGPSKGYIKELADRLNTLEGAMQAGELPSYLAHHDSPTQRRTSEEFTPPPNVDGTQRKRTYSSISNEYGTPYQPQRSSGWGLQDSQRQHPPSFATPQTGGSGQMFREPNYSPNGLQPTPTWRNQPEHRPSAQFEGAAALEQSTIEHGPEWDDGIVEQYYNIIHPTYPLLPQSGARLSAKLSSCSNALRFAFLEALHAAVRSFPSVSVPPSDPQMVKKAMQFILAAQYESSTSRSASTNLIYLQAMMLLAIEADNSAAALHGESSSSRSVLLGAAVGLAYSIKLHLHKQPDKLSENDPDSDEKLSRRVWWSLVIMDRWHAASTGTPLLIPDSSVVTYPEDQNILGDAIYNIARMSIVLGHISTVTITPTDLPTLAIPPAPIVGTLMRGELERCRESLPQTLFPPSKCPVLHLCYWSIRILLELRLPDSEPYELSGPAMNLITQLAHNTTTISPLNYHATALAALTLLELTGFETTREEAEGSLNTILDGRIAPSSWDSAIRDYIIKKRQPGSSGGASGVAAGTQPSNAQQNLTTSASQGLQRLADLATATEEGRVESTASEGRRESEKSITTASNTQFKRYNELRELVRNGYIMAFTGEITR